MGDAQLSLRRAPDHHFGIVLIDAFGSDAIPIHLMTREAVASYLAKLAPDGIIALHISNRYLVLAPVLAGIAPDAGLAGRQSIAAEMIVLAREERHLAPLDASGTWQRIASIPPAKAWTDDYSNIVGALR